MKRYIQLAGCLATMLFLVSCSSLHQSAISAPTVIITKEIVPKPDIEIGEKIEGEAVMWLRFGITSGANRFADGINFYTEPPQYHEILPLWAKLYLLAMAPFFLGATAVPVVFDVVIAEANWDDYPAARAAAAYNACKNAGADVIVNPVYNIEVTKYFTYYKRIKVTVTGYKGTVKGIAGVEYKDPFFKMKKDDSPRPNIN